MFNRVANGYQTSPYNVECGGNIEYQRYTIYQGQMPQYPYFMPPTYNLLPNGENVGSPLVYSPNMTILYVPPPYPPH